VVPGAVSEYCDEVIITEDHGQIDAIARVEPAAIFGTQMERRWQTAKYTGVIAATRSHPELSNRLQAFPRLRRHQSSGRFGTLHFRMEDHP